jgi:hypothetical protein
MEQQSTPNQVSYENVFTMAFMNEIDLSTPEVYQPYIEWIARNYYCYDNYGNYLETEAQQKEYFEDPNQSLRTTYNDFLGRIVFETDHIDCLIENGFKFKYSKADYMEQVLKFVYMAIHNMSETNYQDNRFFSNILIGMNKLYHLCYEEPDNNDDSPIGWKFQDVMNSVKDIVYNDIEDNVYKSLIFEKLRDYLLYCDIPYTQQDERELERLSLQVVCYVRDYYHVFYENLDNDEPMENYLYNTEYRHEWREQIIQMNDRNEPTTLLSRIYPNNQTDYNNSQNLQNN